MIGEGLMSKPMRQRCSGVLKCVHQSKEVVQSMSSEQHGTLEVVGR